MRADRPVARRTLALHQSRWRVIDPNLGGHIVSTHKLIMTTLVGWPVVIASTLAARTAFLGGTISVVELTGWAFLASAPVAITFILDRGRPTTSVAHVLFDAEKVTSNANAARVVPRG
jgi:hypothetical protein